MYDIIPLVLILVSLAVIIYITVRKFPALASLDAANIPAEKEARIKERILSSRLKRNLLKWNTKFIKLWRPLAKGFTDSSRWIYRRLIDLKEGYKIRPSVLPEEMEKNILMLFEEADNLRRQDELSAVEKKLIEIISLEPKSIKAFKQLAQLYFERKELEEAKQTFEHILKLHEGDEEAYEGLAQIASKSGNLEIAKEEYLASLGFDKQRSQTVYNLALVYEEMNNQIEALATVKLALALEPMNPRYLDTTLRLSIMLKDKEFALESYEALKKSNPDNQKLVEFKEQIDLL